MMNRIDCSEDIKSIMLLDKPYVSKFMEKTLIKTQLPVLITNPELRLTMKNRINTIDEKEFTKNISGKKIPLILTNSEETFETLYKVIKKNKLYEKILLFKDKLKFREETHELFPGLKYCRVKFKDLDNFDYNNLDFPVILKPVFGFFSKGIKKVDSKSDWEKSIRELEKEIKKLRKKNEYKKEVVNYDRYIVEKYISGEEYAIDVYFNKNGMPVILNIFLHIFITEEDTKDVLYITNRKLIKDYYSTFIKHITEIGKLGKLKNFPMHIEFRINEAGKIFPIEVNPMRFAGWCTADLAYHAYGINVYEYYFTQKEPNWDTILNEDDDNIYAFFIAHIPEYIDREKIKKVDRQLFEELIKTVLSQGNLIDYRPINYKEYQVFAVIFIKSKSLDELKELGTKDLTKYLILS